MYVPIIFTNSDKVKTNVIGKCTNFGLLSNDYKYNVLI